MDVHFWVASIAELTKPDDIVWCDGSDAEWERLTSQLVDAGTLSNAPPWFYRASSAMKPGFRRISASRLSGAPPPVPLVRSRTGSPSHVRL